MLSILVVTFLGAVLGALIGTVWYGPFTPMGRWHMAYLGFDKLTKEEQAKKIAEAKPQMPKQYALQFLLSALNSFFVAFVMKNMVANGQPKAGTFGYLAMIWICFVVPVVGSSLLWGNCPPELRLKRLASDSGHFLAATMATGVLAALLM